MLALGGVSYVNQWYNGGSALDVKPLVFAGIGLLFLELLAAAPGMDGTATLLGWLAFTGMMISPVQNPSPAQNLLSITAGKGK
jgi:hypothetical protein